MPEIELGNLKVKMTVDEFIDFIKRTDPSEMAAKLQAIAVSTKASPTPQQ